MMSLDNEIIDDFRIDRNYCKCENDCTKSCSCANSVYNFECAPDCSCKFMNCKNRKLQKGLGIRLKLSYIDPNKGFGVISTNLIKEGEFICEYIGELLNRDQVSLIKDCAYLLQIREISYCMINIEKKKYSILTLIQNTKVILHDFSTILVILILFLK